MKNKNKRIDDINKSISEMINFLKINDNYKYNQKISKCIIK